MSIDVEALLAPLSDDAPCGIDLEYDDAFLELEQAAKGSPERSSGDEVIEAEPANWKKVYESSLSLCERTRDLRVQVLLVASALELNGLAGLRDGLALIRGSIEQYWTAVHPQLDPDDDNDPIMRRNAIMALSPPPGSMGDELRVVQRVREIPLTDSALMGKFGLRDIEIARGTVAAADGEATPAESSTIEAAFGDTSTEHLTELSAYAEGAAEELAGVDRSFSEAAGPEGALSFTALAGVLRDVISAIRQQLVQRGELDEDPAGDEVESAESGSVASGAPGEIRSRQDVVSSLDRICRYYDQQEPSSPVPLLLRRAQRLVTVSFVEAVRDLMSEDALRDLERVGGETYAEE